ncbi:MAG: DNA mismatch repair protein MutS [Myxococcota bacterium]
MREPAGASAAAAVSETYAAALSAIAAEESRLGAEDDRYARLRGIAFLLAGGGFIAALFVRTPAVWLGVAAAATTFLVFVVRHAQVSTRQFDLARRRSLFEHGQARIAGTYRSDEPTRRGDAHRDEEHPFTSDLDVFGPASLFEQLNVAQTPGGSERLAAWLQAPAGADDVARRQHAAQALARDAELRERLALAGMRAASETRALGPPTALLTWAQRPPVMIVGPVGRIALPLAALLVVATVGLIGVSAAGLGAARAWWIPVAMNVGMLLALRGRIGPVVGPVVVKQSPLPRYAAMMEIVESTTFDDPTLTRIRGRLVPPEGGPRASEALGRLERYLGLASVRHNALALVLFNVFLLWDVFMADRIDRWRAAHGAQLEGWLDALSELEALRCLATFAAEHPDFAWPDLSGSGETPATFVAEGLGHPLLPADRRVTNDVRLEAATRALMVTGSNMSGKSTMLRSMGVAAVLAQAGAPVCARTLRMSPRLEVHTSMRIGDALDRGASRFYAEVRKLKRVVDAARRTADASSSASASPSAVFFLLDEVLHGTNSRERNIGAKSVVRYLVDRGAIGAVSSHDHGLVALETLTASRVVNRHFEDHLANGEMAFDYTMKAGPVSTSNALRLMRSVGIDIPGLSEPDEASSSPRPSTRSGPAPTSGPDDRSEPTPEPRRGTE